MNLKKIYNTLNQEYGKSTNFKIPIGLLKRYSVRIPRKFIILFVIIFPALLINYPAQAPNMSGAWDEFMQWLSNASENGLGGAVNGLIGSIMGLENCDDAIKTLQNSLLPGDIMSLFPMTLSIIKGLAWVDGWNREAQTAIVTAINVKKGVFAYLTNAIRIFAVIACVWKIVEHYMKTEDHTSVASYFGYFKFIPLLMLFALGTPIARSLYAKQQGVVNVAFNQMSGKILNAVKGTETQLKQQIEDEIRANCSPKVEGTNNTVTGNQVNYADKLMIRMNFTITKFFMDLKFSISSFFALIVVGAFSTASVMMTVITYLFFDVLMAGTGIVFMLGFIPQFKNAWVSYLSNFLNMLLWSPIFNAILLGLFSIISGAINPDLNIGNLAYLAFLVTAMASQIIPITISASNLIISGAGAGASASAGALNGTTIQDIAGKMLK